MPNTNFLPLIILIIIPIGIIFYMLNKKKKQNDSTFVGNRKTRKDEVWNIVKKYLKENNEIGKEILQLFPAKKRDENDVSLMSKEEKKRYKDKKKEFKKTKKTDPEAYKQAKKEKKQKAKNKPPEEWFLYFQTWNSKNKVIDNPRILEVEVKYIKVDKKRTERKVFVKGLADFEKEFAWIAPLKEKEDKILDKQRKINEAKRKKYLEQEKKRKEKQKKNTKR